jgi:hypothetical protein
MMALVAGCSSGGTTTPGGTPGFSIEVIPASFSLLAGSNATAAVTLTRTNFTGSVNLSITNFPAGVTATFLPNNTTGSVSAMTLNVGANVAPGVYPIYVGGVGAGVHDQVTPLSLTVGAAGSFSLSLSSATASIVQGAGGTATVNITRGSNFTGSVALGVSGAPTGMTATVSPASTASTSATLTLTTTSALAPGTYVLTIQGSSAGVATQQATLTVTITSASGGSGNVTLDWSECPAAQRPNWVAYQDGSGPWTVVTSSDAMYHFTLTSGRAGYAYQLLGTQVIVTYQTRTELTSVPVTFCATPAVLLPAMTGTIAGLAAGEKVTVSLGNSAAIVTAPATALSLTGMSPVMADLVAYRSQVSGASAADRMLFVRDIAITNGGSAGTVNLATAVAVATGAITVANSAGNTLSAGMTYLSGASCTQGSLYQFAPGATSFTAFGAPAASQRASDFHLLSITGIGSNNNRVVQEVFHTMAARTMTLPSVVSAPTVTSLGGSYKRLQAAYTIPADYTTGSGFMYIETATSKVFSMYASAAYTAGATQTLAAPNFSGLSGWSDSWAPGSAVTVNWTLTTNGNTLASTICTEGYQVVQSQVTGTN